MSFDWVFGITVGYLLMVLLGPRIMANRQAWTLRPVMITYNFLMTLVNLWMFLEASIAIIYAPLPPKPTQTPSQVKVFNPVLALLGFLVSVP